MKQAQRRQKKRKNYSAEELLDWLVVKTLKALKVRLEDYKRRPKEFRYPSLRDVAEDAVENLISEEEQAKLAVVSEILHTTCWASGEGGPHTPFSALQDATENEVTDRASKLLEEEPDDGPS